jgi:hypothetical protein
MKGILYITSIVIAIAAIGCENNNVAGPTESNAVQQSVLNKVAPSSAVGFSQLVKYQDTMLKVTGQAVYTISQSPNMKTDMYDVAISTKGNLQPLNVILQPWKDKASGVGKNISWKIDGSSTEQIEIDSKVPVTLDKMYLILGMVSDMPCYLHVRFSVSRTQVSVLEMWVVNG